MPCTPASQKSRRFCGLLSILLVVGGYSCDKSKSKPCDTLKDATLAARVEPVDVAPPDAGAVIAITDVGPTVLTDDDWQPPPVVRTPDASSWAPYAKMTPEDPALVASRAAVKAQQVLIAESTKQMDEVRHKLEEAKKAVKKRKAAGKKGYEKWRKAAGTKLPPMPDLGSKKVLQPEGKAAVDPTGSHFPRIMPDDGGDP